MLLKMVTEIVEEKLSEQKPLERIARRFINAGLFNKTQLVYRDNDDNGAYVVEIKHYKATGAGLFFPPADDEIPESEE